MQTFCFVYCVDVVTGSPSVIPSVNHMLCAFSILNDSLFSSLLHNKLDTLRHHEPPPIQRIRISDFGLPDPKRDPDRHQNCITWSLSHALPLKKFRQNPFTSLRVIRRTDRQTDKQTNRPHQKHNLLLRRR